MELRERIWQQAQAGDRAGAKRELASIVRAHPEDVQAWLLLAVLLDDPVQQADCCRRVLRLDPGNPRATALLDKITRRGGVSQPSTTTIDLRCPNCGASLDFEAVRGTDTHPAICVYCGTTVALTEHGLEVVRLPVEEPDMPSEVRAVPEIPELFEYTHDGEIDAEKIAELEKEDLTQFVVRELVGEADRNALIRQVCVQNGISWAQAEAFVARVALDYEREIARRRSPFMLMLSVATLVGGVVLVLFCGYAIVAWFSSEPLLRLDYTIYGFLSGLGMTSGGFIGVVRTLKSLRDSDY